MMRFASAGVVYTQVTMMMSTMEPERRKSLGS